MQKIDLNNPTIVAVTIGGKVWERMTEPAGWKNVETGETGTAEWLASMNPHTLSAN